MKHSLDVNANLTSLDYGGELLIGVSDNGEILGFEEDYNKLKKANKDYFELHLKNLINNSIGKEFGVTGINVKFPILEEKELCEIDIQAGSKLSL